MGRCVLGVSRGTVRAQEGTLEEFKRQIELLQMWRHKAETEALAYKTLLFQEREAHLKFQSWAMAALQEKQTMQFRVYPHNVQPDLAGPEVYEESLSSSTKLVQVATSKRFQDPMPAQVLKEANPRTQFSSHTDRSPLQELVANHSEQRDMKVIEESKVKCSHSCSGRR